MRGFPSLWCTVSKFRSLTSNSLPHLAQIMPWMFKDCSLYVEIVEPCFSSLTISAALLFSAGLWISRFLNRKRCLFPINSLPKRRRYHTCLLLFAPFVQLILEEPAFNAAIKKLNPPFSPQTDLFCEVGIAGKEIASVSLAPLF